MYVEMIVDTSIGMYEQVYVPIYRIEKDDTLYFTATAIALHSDTTVTLPSDADTVLVLVLQG